MTTNNWREEFENRFVSFYQHKPEHNHRNSGEIEDFIQSLLDKQKEEIVEWIIKAVDDTCYLNEQWSTVIADSHIDRLIKQIKEI